MKPQSHMCDQRSRRQRDPTLVAEAAFCKIEFFVVDKFELSQYAEVHKMRTKTQKNPNSGRPNLIVCTVFTRPVEDFEFARSERPYSADCK